MKRGRPKEGGSSGTCTGRPGPEEAVNKAPRTPGPCVDQQEALGRVKPNRVRRPSFLAGLSGSPEMGRSTTVFTRQRPPTGRSTRHAHRLPMYRSPPPPTPPPRGTRDRLTRGEGRVKALTDQHKGSSSGSRWKVRDPGSRPLTETTPWIMNTCSGLGD